MPQTKLIIWCMTIMPLLLPQMLEADKSLNLQLRQELEDNFLLISQFICHEYNNYYSIFYTGLQFAQQTQAPVAHTGG